MDLNCCVGRWASRVSEDSKVKLTACIAKNDRSRKEVTVTESVLMEQDKDTGVWTLFCHVLL